MPLRATVFFKVAAALAGAEAEQMKNSMTDLSESNPLWKLARWRQEVAEEIRGQCHNEWVVPEDEILAIAAHTVNQKKLTYQSGRQEMVQTVVAELKKINDEKHGKK